MNLNCKNTFDIPISNPQNSLLFLEETLHTFGSPVPFRIILGFDLLVVPMTVEDGVTYVEIILRVKRVGDFGEMIVIVLRSKINLDNLICGESDDWLAAGGSIT